MTRVDRINGTPPTTRGGSSPQRPRPSRGAADLVPVSGSPMMALITAQHFSQQLAMRELSGLATDQKSSNDALSRVRAVEEHLAKMISGGRITRAALDELKQLGEEVGVDLSGGIDALHALVDYGVGWMRDNQPDQVPASRDEEWGNYMVGSEEDHQRAARDAVKAMGEQLTRRRDDIKGDASNRELDIQRVSQELSSAMQLQSNLSKRWSDTLNGIVSNAR